MEAYDITKSIRSPTAARVCQLLDRNIVLHPQSKF